MELNPVHLVFLKHSISFEDLFSSPKMSKSSKADFESQRFASPEISIPIEFAKRTT